MKVFLLADVPDGWIVSRCCDRMVAGMPDIEFVRGHYCCLSTNEIIDRAKGCDLIHFANWNVAQHIPGVLAAGVPVLVSVRSFRYPECFHEVARQVHVHTVNPLMRDVPRYTYIPDGVMIEPQPLRVGFAGKPGEYKGTGLIRQACEKIGATFVVASDLEPDAMRDWYESIDVLACASVAEGYCAPVMEALALNKPVVSVRTGAAWCAQIPGVTWVDRDWKSIAEGLLKHWTSRHLCNYTWPVVCDEFRQLYRRLCAA